MVIMLTLIAVLSVVSFDTADESPKLQTHVVRLARKHKKMSHATHLRHAAQ